MQESLETICDQRVGDHILRVDKPHEKMWVIIDESAITFSKENRIDILIDRMDFKYDDDGIYLSKAECSVGFMLTTYTKELTHTTKPRCNTQEQFIEFEEFLANAIVETFGK